MVGLHLRFYCYIHLKTVFGYCLPAFTPRLDKFIMLQRIMPIDKDDKLWYKYNKVKGRLDKHDSIQYTFDMQTLILSTFTT